jgi:hypothetical protein
MTAEADNLPRRVSYGAMTAEGYLHTYSVTKQGSLLVGSHEVPHHSRRRPLGGRTRPLPDDAPPGHGQHRSPRGPDSRPPSGRPLRHGRMLGGTSVDARQHRERLRWFN